MRSIIKRARNIGGTLLLLSLTGCAGTGARIVGGTAQILGTVVKRGDEIYAPLYKAHAAQIYTSPAYATLVRDKGADAAVAFYSAEMKPWDGGVQVIRSARAAVFAIGTAAESTRKADKTANIVEATAYGVGAVIGMTQTLEALGVHMPPELISALGHSCTFVTALARGVNLSADKLPETCTPITRTGLLGAAARPAGTPGPATVTH